MASKQSTVDYIVEQASGAGHVAAKKMFGEYGIYCDGKMVALVCGDQLFVKPTPGGKAHIGAFLEGIPYPGAKPCLLIEPGQWDDADWLADLFKIASNELPEPKKKQTRPAKRSR